MKLNRKRILFLGALLSGILSLAQNLQAFVYTNRDLMLCFRKVQRNGGTPGPYDYEINIGQASKDYAGTNLTLSQFTSGQLASIFDDLNNVSWSVGGAVGLGDGGDPGVPANTLWVTAKRTDPNVQSIPPIRKSTGTQAGVRTQINSIGANARTYSGLPTTPIDGTNNTATAVRIPEGSGYNYSQFVGALGNYSGTFWGDVEDSTASDFTTSGVPSRVDLYELRPGSGSGTWLGYFQFNAGGTVSFTAASTTPPSPVIMGITRDSDNSVISFTTASGVLYNLRYTNTLGSGVQTWPMVPNAVTGNGSVMSVTNVTSDSTRFYLIEAHH